MLHIHLYIITLYYFINNFLIISIQITRLNITIKLYFNYTIIIIVTLDVYDVYYTSYVYVQCTSYIEYSIHSIY